MATMTAVETPSQPVRAIIDLTTDSFTLDYGEHGPSEKVLLTDLVALVPAAFSDDAQTDDLQLLFVHTPAGADEDSHDGTSDSFAGQLATRRLSKARAEPLSRYILPKLPDYLNIWQGRQFHVVISTRSGVCDAEVFFENLVQPVLSHLGFLGESDRNQSYEVHVTSSDRSVSDLAENVIGPNANRGIPQTLLLLAGDGSVIDTINGVCSLPQKPGYVKPVIGLLALGTGNALANSNGLNNDATRGLSSFLRGQPKPLPTFQAKFSPGSELLSHEARGASPLPLRDSNGVGTMFGVVVASWALHASLVGDSDSAEYRKHGPARFAMAAEELLSPSDGSEPHVYQGRVLVYQRTGAGAEYPIHWERQEHMYVLATFVSNLEKNFNISPRSKPLDKSMRMVHWGKLDSHDITDIFALAYSGGKHTELDVVGYEAIEGFRIDFDEPDGRWRRVCIDGKIIRVNEGGWVEIRKQDREVVDLVTDAA